MFSSVNKTLKKDIVYKYAIVHIFQSYDYYLLTVRLFQRRNVRQSFFFKKLDQNDKR